jgi:hypothetical protein
MEDAESCTDRATGAAGIAGIEARRAAHLALDHKLRVYVATPDYGFNPALWTTLTAATAIPSRAAEAPLLRGRIGWAGIRITALRRSVRRLTPDTAIGAVAVEAFAAGFSVLPQFPGPRALMLALPLALSVAAAFASLAVRPPALAAVSPAQIAKCSTAPGDGLPSQLIIGGERIRTPPDHRPAQDKTQNGPQSAAPRLREAEESGQAIECNIVHVEVSLSMAEVRNLAIGQ